MVPSFLLPFLSVIYSVLNVFICGCFTCLYHEFLMGEEIVPQSSLILLTLLRAREIVAKLVN